MRASPFRIELRELFRLALPLAAAQAGTQMMGLVDIAVLGRVGAAELAGAGLANAIYFAVSVFGMGVIFGIDPLISQALGAGDRARARQLLWQGGWLAMAVTAVLTVVLLSGAAAIPYMGVQPELIAPATTFLSIRTFTLAPFLLFFVIRAYLQAQHLTRPLVTAMVVANVVNLVLDLYLVFGGSSLPAWCGPLRAMPAMGVTGAALATVAATLAEVAIVVVAVRRVIVPERVNRRWNSVEIVRAFRLGLPVGLQLGAEIGVFALVGILAARLGTLHLAAHQTVISIASFTYTAALGVASAGSVRVGNAIGARDPLRTRDAGHAAFVGGGLVMAIAATAFALFPEGLARLITDQTAVIAAAIPLFVVAAVFQMSDGIQAVGSGVLRGAGDTRYTFTVNLIGHWFVGLPVALYLGFRAGLGIVGLWWGLCAGLTVVAILLFLRFEKLSRGEIRPL